ncbi:hypothetical protein HGI09_59110 [Streptomyces collinus]|nr:hypothetical protein HGI10_04980 [Streptomyces collinus]UJA12213.1 hypothetical protein HGI10_61950 [Streptomyces collinus]UJA12921.1 hypothetical protein HGI09_02150 [Streptomyces collinus]UJA18517.1 hypothetical protein HGI09_59110 [Streptomyces collinus]
MNFSPTVTSRTVRSVVQAAFRLVTGFLFACHGAASMPRPVRVPTGPRL